MGVGEASDGGVEANGDGAAVDLVDGAGVTLEVAGADVVVEADARADGQLLEGAPGLIGGDAAVPVVDRFAECG